MNPLHAIIAKVEADHFRTVTDSGGHEKARLILNAFRRHAGLPYVTLDDLPAWNGSAYEMPRNSKLLTNPLRPDGPVHRSAAAKAAEALGKLPIGCLSCEREAVVQAAIDEALQEAREAHDLPGEEA